METAFSSTVFTNEDIALRLLIATVAGLLLGLDRSMRGISAGIRTHALVSLSSAVITVSALMLYGEIRALGEEGDLDPLRVIQGLAQAIGFIAAGTIFVSKGDVQNLTSAANVWLAAAIGICAGAGQLFLVLAATLAGIVILTIVRLVERYIPGSNKADKD